VFVEVDLYRVTGTAHIGQGEVMDDGLRDRQPFLALTKAKVEISGEITKLDVVIVNLGASARFGPVSEGSGS